MSASAALDLADAAARARAVAALSRPPVGAELTVFIYRGLGDGDFMVRNAVIDRVSTWPRSDELLDALGHSARDGQVVRRASALSALGRLGQSATSVLAGLLGEPHAGLRRLAVDTLGTIPCEESNHLVQGALADPSAVVRAAAAEALGTLQGKGAAEAIANRLPQERSPSVILASLLALNDLGATVPSSTLRRFIPDPLAGGPALELAARSGDVELLVDGLRSATGTRLRHAMAGLAAAWPRMTPIQRTLVRGVDVADDRIDRVLLSAPEQPVLGALLLAGATGRVAWFRRVAERPDRAQLLPAAHTAVAHIDDPAVSREFARLSKDASGPAAAFLLELSTALLQRGTADRTEPRTASFPKPTFERLADVLAARAGLAIDPRTADRLESRLLPRLRQVRVANITEYVDLITSGSPAGEKELARALNRITVHETYFYREKQQLDAFKNYVLDHLFSLSSGNWIKVLSAGCATGEEVYSLAILLKDAGVQRFSVIGVDVASETVDVARAGRYGRRGLRGEMPRPLRDRYLSRDEESPDVFTVSDEIREHCSFEVGNLADPAFVATLPRVHAVFCRNMMIYLHADARRAVVDGLFGQLWPGGALFLGHSESLLHVDTPFRFTTIGRDFVYLRPFEDGTVPALGGPR